MSYIQLGVILSLIREDNLIVLMHVTLLCMVFLTLATKILVLEIETHLQHRKTAN